MTLRVKMIGWVALFGALSGSAAYRLEPLASGADYPVEAVLAPGDPGTTYVVEKAGRVRILRNGKWDPTPLLDLSDHVLSGGEQGLLGLVFHPEFNKAGKNAGRLFVNYTTSQPRRRTVVAEIKLPEKKEREILSIDQPYSNHNGGQLAFDKQGYLYIGMGDGGSGGDPHNHSQNLDSLLGKMLRIDINRAEPYAIPPDNPLVGKKGRPEIFAWGLRNPWRFSFDKPTGRLFAADVGQNLWEEIDIVEKGKNYGWRVREGAHCYDSETCSSQGLTDPIAEYSHSEGQSVTGGFVYRGKKIKELQGEYVFADFASQKIWAIKQTPGGSWSRRLLLDSKEPVAAFGQDATGELLVVAHRPASQPSIFRLLGP